MFRFRKFCSSQSPALRAMHDVNFRNYDILRAPFVRISSSALNQCNLPGARPSTSRTSKPVILVSGGGDAKNPGRLMPGGGSKPGRLPTSGCAGGNASVRSSVIGRSRRIRRGKVR